MRTILLILLIACTSYCHAQCNAGLWSHVYHAYRLVVHDSCTTITGTVYSLIYEADGDIHIRITLDDPYTSMLNSSNYSGQYGKLVCEPICVTTITQSDAVLPCSAFVNHVNIPNVGEHVAVTGSYVTDNDHGWNEIHPVTSITFPAAVENTTAQEGMQVSAYPNPANDNIHFKLSKKPNSLVSITILNTLGELGGEYQMLETQNLDVNTRYLPAGKYYYHLEQAGKHLQSGSFVITH